MSAHTPGPWKVLADTRTGAVDVWSGARFVCTVGVPGASGDESIEPDAALIAAAPDLLAAAKYAQSWLEAMRDPASDPGMVARGELTVWAALRDAVAKAEGR